MNAASACRLTLMLAVATLVAARPAPGENAGLSGAAQAFVRQLETASWSSSASAGGVTVRARQVALGSQGMLDLLGSQAAIPEKAAEALKSLAEIEFSEPGWFGSGEVKAGTYVLGLERGPKNLRLVLRDREGKAAMSDGFWVEGTTEATAKAGATAAGGAAFPDVSCGGIHLSWRFVSGRAHQQALGPGLQEVQSGPVTLHSDLGRPDELRRLCDECAAAIAPHAKLIGRDAPAGPFHVYLLSSLEAYRRIDNLLTGGAFSANGAFSTRLTGRSYIWYWLPTGSEFFADCGIPLRIRALALHELFHVVSERARPEAPNWPRWLTEGLAELASEKALPATDGRAKFEIHLGQWRDADEVQSLPTAVDLMAGAAGDNLAPYYASAYLLLRRLASQPDKLAALLDSLQGWDLPFECAAAAREALEKGFGPATEVWRQVREEAARDSKGLVVLAPGNGVLDRIDGAWRIASRQDGEARVRVPLVLSGSKVAFEGEFALQPAGARQADFYLSWARGRDADEFLKLAIQPDSVTLFRFRDSRWTTLGAVSYKTAIEVGSGNDFKWHTATLVLDREAGKLRVDLETKRWAEFALKEFLPSDGAAVGFGTWGGVAYFRNIRQK